MEFISYNDIKLWARSLRKRDIVAFFTAFAFAIVFSIFSILQYYSLNTSFGDVKWPDSGGLEGPGRRDIHDRGRWEQSQPCGVPKLLPSAIGNRLDRDRAAVGGAVYFGAVWSV